jgi:ATP-dependent Clp protease adaptor protein ClpS
MGTQTLERTETDLLLEKERSLILYNDEVNTFDFVIDSLIEVCEHDPIQAEQCTFIVHFKGKCDVYSGSQEELTGMCHSLLNRGLTAEIE